MVAPGNHPLLTETTEKDQTRGAKDDRDAARRDLKARLSKQERADDTRRKVLLGGLVLHYLKARPDEKFSRRLEDFLRRILPRVRLCCMEAAKRALAPARDQL